MSLLRAAEVRRHRGVKPVNEPVNEPKTPGFRGVNPGQGGCVGIYCSTRNLQQQQQTRRLRRNLLWFKTQSCARSYGPRFYTHRHKNARVPDVERGGNITRRSPAAPPGSFPLQLRTAPAPAGERRKRPAGWPEICGGREEGGGGGMKRVIYLVEGANLANNQHGGHKGGSFAMAGCAEYLHCRKLYWALLAQPPERLH